jgi:hypothetical protein
MEAHWLAPIRITMSNWNTHFLSRIGAIEGNLARFPGTQLRVLSRQLRKAPEECRTLQNWMSSADVKPNRDTPPAVPLPQPPL